MSCGPMVWILSSGFTLPQPVCGFWWMVRQLRGEDPTTLSNERLDVEVPAKLRGSVGQGG